MAGVDSGLVGNIICILNIIFIIIVLIIMRVCSFGHFQRYKERYYPVCDILTEASYLHHIIKNYIINIKLFITTKILHQKCCAQLY